jgi:hypothetical protein
MDQAAGHPRGDVVQHIALIPQFKVDQARNTAHQKSSRYSNSDHDELEPVTV